MWAAASSSCHFVFYFIIVVCLNCVPKHSIFPSEGQRFLTFLLYIFYHDNKEKQGYIPVIPEVMFFLMWFLQKFSQALQSWCRGNLDSALAMSLTQEVRRARLTTNSMFQMKFFSYVTKLLCISVWKKNSLYKAQEAFRSHLNTLFFPLPSFSWIIASTVHRS